MEFNSFNKIPRLSRDCVVTEKIDGTNAQIYIAERNEFTQEQLDNPKIPYMSVSKDGVDYIMIAGSRTRWISTIEDNMGFGRWVSDNRDELLKLGIGRHFGEWWGQKIQRTYNLKEKRFSLFNTGKWTSEFNNNLTGLGSTICNEVPVCYVVPVLYVGLFDTNRIETIVENLRDTGSFANPGYKSPEGIVIYHIAGNLYFKKTILNDESPKGANANN